MTKCTPPQEVASALPRDRRGRAAPAWTSALVIVALVAPLGCVSAAHADVEAARKALRTCQSRHPDDPAACDAERAAYESASQRYERQSRQAWGCDPAQEQCPTPR